MISEDLNRMLGFSELVLHPPYHASFLKMLFLGIRKKIDWYNEPILIIHLASLTMA